MGFARYKINGMELNRKVIKGAVVEHFGLYLK